MSTEPLNLAVIIGSTRKGRFGPVPANWFADQARKHGDYNVDVIDLLDADLPMHIEVDDHPHVEAVSERLHKADAVVIVTPEYNHSFPASLKAAIDWYQAEWHAMPVGFVSYGGMVGGQRAVEQLRQIFPEVHALTIRNTLNFVNFWDKFDDQGQPRELDATNKAAKELLDQLGWWARALKQAREASPYPG
ncbi:NADPH-dependent FMN reductase [Stackebrandtia nassauensis]|uniref:NADPH-dependent FMN reductase n=1 Tax=Stackebrandtia nassauensis (strain DSM 44728 / CIP 108903 / NRRL B-16338 / NBRC 102104 / LLR-40K-21) TaxID=446470 RepID=D3PTX9_STANL|nr:NAD(P)H-dependent oxidoreductase [Stackebrandtia nassauensis]ADD39737.1 NADPH-dependent FMN reductase [Stackebrandtia nassauensis DSM 44728]